jgi:beta-aspartyl-peptidase (threonine type)
MLSKSPSSHPAISPSRRGIGISLLTRTRNPSHLARTLYLSPSVAPHAFLSGQTVEALGESLGEETVDPSYFFTEHRWRAHRRALGLPEEPFPPGTTPLPEPPASLDHLPAGTVGAVALDTRGCIAVMTSTGGLTNKLVGRIGDTPMMGAGFWAEEWAVGWGRRIWDTLKGKRHAKKRAVGISGTGDGDVSRLNASDSCKLTDDLVFHPTGHGLYDRPPGQGFA